MTSKDYEKGQNDNSFKNFINIPYIFLKIANRYTEMNPLLDEFILEIKKLTKCDSVGIRLLDTEGNIPYEAYQGFSEEFYQSESPLSIKSDKCMCINVIKGDADPEQPFYTNRGSFFMNTTTKFLATVSEEEKGETRNVCNLSGYESVALVAISLKDRIFGLIHLADHHENMVPLEIVEILENVAMQLATAIQRVWIQQELKNSEERFRQLFNTGFDSIIILNEDKKIIDVNETTCKLLEYDKEEILNLSLKDIIHEKDLTKMDETIDNYKKNYIGIKCETIFLTKERKSIVMEAGFTNLKIKKNSFIVGSFRDISDQKNKEREIYDLARFPSESPYPILRVNRNKVIYINEAGNKLLNIGILSPIPDFLQNDVKKTYESNQISESECEIAGRIYSFFITPVKNSDYINIYGMDITERKHIEEKLKELNELKSEFLRRASHELKTPLISIKGFSELILNLYEDQLDEPITTKIKEINDGCERLQSIINNLLKATKLELPDLKPKVQKENLSFLIKFCVNELESLAEKRKQSIKLDIHSELSANFEKEEIHDVISNLLSNAIKYTPIMGEIEIKTELKENNVVVSVKDNGIGFTEAQKTRIFQQFGKIERYGQGLDLRIEGTGLGLFISKKIVESHGGKIWMESEGKNKGSSFYFTLPFNDLGLL
ncbi:hypothetical protein LCGC14_1454290 [marine sediment metagenome]|uniref:histidine kinase n=1 Tax=marine sediment metagenome TaxID=412755 RepID=A0A0F9MIT3_9ZZZZ